MLNEHRLNAPCYAPGKAREWMLGDNSPRTNVAPCRSWHRRRVSTLPGFCLPSPRVDHQKTSPPRNSETSFHRIVTSDPQNSLYCTIKERDKKDNKCVLMG